MGRGVSRTIRKPRCPRAFAGLAAGAMPQDRSGSLAGQEKTTEEGNWWTNCAGVGTPSCPGCGRPPPGGRELRQRGRGAACIFVLRIVPAHRPSSWWGRPAPLAGDHGGCHPVLVDAGEVKALPVSCPRCGAMAGAPCRTTSGRGREPHAAREHKLKALQGR